MKNLFRLFFFVFFFSQTSAQNFSTGCEFNPERYAATPQAVPLTTRSYDDLPAAYSLKKYCPIPNDQVWQSSCVGWATAYAARTILESVAKNRIDASVSTQEAFSPSYVYNQIKLNPQCKAGSYISEALSLMYNKGNIKLRDFPYICEKTPDYSDHNRATNYKIADYIRLTSAGFPFSETEKPKQKT